MPKKLLFNIVYNILIKITMEISDKHPLPAYSVLKNFIAFFVQNDGSEKIIIFH